MAGTREKNFTMNMKMNAQTINCERCGGLMVPHRFPEYSSGTSRQYGDGFRCVNCGEVVDGVVLQNRTKPEAAPSQTIRRWKRKLAA